MFVWGSRVTKGGFVVKCVFVCPYSANVDGMRMMCVMVSCLCGYM